MKTCLKSKIVGLFALAALLAAAALCPAAEPDPEKQPPQAKPGEKRWDYEAPIKPRFEIKERDWPAQYGDAGLCLWKDDALAAFSITIDDNCFGDTPWWLSMGEKYNLRFTWFIITRRVCRGENPAANGTWEGWKKIHAAGHDVQSHTALHGHTEDPDWKNVDDEYASSKKEIEENMPGNKCLVLGYFGGANGKLNDPAVATKYYIGARGSGLINKANQINYMLIHSTGGVNDFHIGDGDHPSADMKSIIEKAKGSMGDFYRGWMNVNSHFIGADFASIRDPEKRETFKKNFTKTSEEIEKRLAALKGFVQEGKLWVGLIREICLYGQERDTASLKVTEKAPGKITFDLTDTLTDKRFDFPLTVKVRLDDSWKTLTATQNSKPIEAKVIQHEGAVYALVQAVPGAGPVTLTIAPN